MSDIIKIQNLYKSFGDVDAVKNLSFKVKTGELFAFLGVNGAGKSTTISMMCNSLSKDSGKIFIDGEDIDVNPEVINHTLGVVFQNSALDKSLTVRENLKHRAALYGIFDDKFEKRLNELIELLKFSDILDRSVGKLSGGQRRKADIARALFHKTKILILDEPTTGLDPQTRITLWDVINDLRKNEGMTVLLTTHYMEEASDADFVVIIDGGETVAEGTPIELKNRYTGDYIMLYGMEVEAVKDSGLAFEKVSEGVLRLEVPSTSVATELIIKYPHLFTDYEVTKGKMDSVFLAVTGKKLSEDK